MEPKAWRRPAVAAMLLTAIAPASLASAQTQQQIDWCVDRDNTTSPDLKISGCTAVIQSGKWNGRLLAGAFINRGIAYYANGDKDRAIADFDQAIQLDPKGAKGAAAYNNRGRMYHVKGDEDRAIADFNQAIQLDPKYAVAYYNRGTAYCAKKDYGRAITDYNEAIRFDPKYPIAYNDRGRSAARPGLILAVTTGS